MNKHEYELLHLLWGSITDEKSRPTKQEPETETAKSSNYHFMKPDAHAHDPSF